MGSAIAPSCTTVLEGPFSKAGSVFPAGWSRRGQETTPLGRYGETPAPARVIQVTGDGGLSQVVFDVATGRPAARTRRPVPARPWNGGPCARMV